MYLNNTSPILSSSEMLAPYQSGSQQAVQPDEASANVSSHRAVPPRGNTEVVTGLSKSYCANSVFK